MDQAKIGKFIAKCRKDKGITQEELAKMLNVTNKSISRYEKGENMPDYKALKKLCEILEIDVNEFLNGEKMEKEELQTHSVKNLDLVLKEYDKMKKRKNLFKKIVIVLVVIFVTVKSVTFLSTIVETYNSFYGVTKRFDVITDTNKYKNVIGPKTKGVYISKLFENEEIFPISIKKLSVEDFKMVYYNPWDYNFLAYLVINYDKEGYNKELERLDGIENYGEEEFSLYGAVGFDNYKMLALTASDYGFTYAITDGKSKIIYVEMNFRNYYTDIKYEDYIPLEYLPNGLNVKMNNPYHNSQYTSLTNNNVNND